MKYEELPNGISVEYEENLIGNKYGELTVLYRIPSTTKTEKTRWACVCSCGEYCDKTTKALINGTATWCRSANHSNLVGQKFGHLVVAKREDEYYNYRGHKYICYCDCGNPEPKYVFERELTNGETKSCGCWTGGAKDITGMKFGMLTAIKPTDKRSCSGQIIWECKCDCGNIVTQSLGSLKNHLVISCGCKKTSYGELLIEQIFKENNILYKFQKTFSSCRFPDTNSRGRFDFYVLENRPFLLEYDGEQHERITPNFWGGKPAYVKMHNHDLYKNQWAWDNNIPMKRIPYKLTKDISLETIMSDKYLITPDKNPEWYPPPNTNYPYFTLDNIA